MSCRVARRGRVVFIRLDGVRNLDSECTHLHTHGLARDAEQASGTATDIERGAEYASSLGATRVIDVQRERFEDVTEPVDAVIDLVGGEVQARSFPVLKRGGYLVSAVSTPNAALALERGVSESFLLVDVTAAALSELATLFDGGKLNARVGLVLPHADARVAHEMLDGSSPRPFGKLVLSM